MVLTRSATRLSGARSAQGSSRPASAPHAAPNGFDRLPDDALLAIFSDIPAQERSGSIARVCRRFRRLAASPVLLASGLHAVVESGSRLGERMASLRAWLERYAAGGQLRQLSLRVVQIYDMRAPTSSDEERQAVQAIDELLAGLRAAFASQPEAAPSPSAPPAAELRLDIDELALPVFVDDSWLPTLQGLSSLQLSGDGIRCIKAQLAQLAGLRQLSLSLRLGWSARIRDTGLLGSRPMSLPASLTALSLASIADNRIQQQIGTLKQLEQLNLQHVVITPFDNHGLECLTAVTSLRRLSLVHCLHLPDCLPLLTWLEGLHWHGNFDCDRPRDGLRELEFKLAPLRHLTYLFFNITGCEYWNVDYDYWEDVPKALAGMTRLHTLGWVLPYNQAALPRTDGPAAWLHSVRQLALDADVAEDSVEQLRQATSLETLCLTRFMEDFEWEQLELVRLAGQLRSLRCFAYQIDPPDMLTQRQNAALGADLARELAAAVQAAQSSNTALRIGTADDVAALLGAMQKGYA